MHVGIKYCGGCNSTYDRALYFKKIKTKWDTYNYSFVENNSESEYDFILVINGCHVACANLEGLISRLGFINIVDDDIYELNKKINTITDMNN